MIFPHDLGPGWGGNRCVEGGVSRLSDRAEGCPVQAHFDPSQPLGILSPLPFFWNKVSVSGKTSSFFFLCTMAVPGTHTAPPTVAEVRPPPTFSKA